jgi:hypothetical protein
MTSAPPVDPQAALAKLDPKVRPRRLEQTLGSTSGSGSGAFHVYREHKRKEMSRIEEFDSQNEEARLKQEFAARQAEHAKADQLRLEKNRNRRKRRKDVGSSSKKEENNDDDEKEENE